MNAVVRALVVAWAGWNWALAATAAHGAEGAAAVDAAPAGATATVESPAAAEVENLYPLAAEGPKPDPITPPTDEEIRASIERGVDFLLGAQRASGAWGGPQKTKGLNIFAPVPGAHHAFRTGVTALAIEALADARPLFGEEKQQAIDLALDRGQAWLFEHSDDLRRAEQDTLYNVWGHSYSLHAIAKLHERAEGNADLQQKLIELAKYHVDRLVRYTFVNGGWNYYDFDYHTRSPASSPTSFTTATGLIGLKMVEHLGVEYPEALTKKAIDSILRQRYADFSYAYGEYLRMRPRLDINRPGGSLGRTQACNLALRMYGHKEVTDEIMKAWLNRLYARNGWLGIGRKRPVPHESHFRVAGYFYYYGHYYAAMCIELLPEAERPYFQDHLARILLPLQEVDGSWWDYPLYDYHQTWGTAMSISALLRCRHDAP